LRVTHGTARSLPDERLGKVLGITAKRTREQFDQALRSAGSSFHVFMVLSHAKRYPGVSQRHLAEQLGIEGPTLVRHVDRLAEEGLVRRVRDERDRRISRVELTPAGEAHLERATVAANRMDAELRTLFTKAELSTLYGLLHRIQDHYSGETDVDDRVG
jgi:MarR family transcriptional regulator for hemolysin